MGRGRSKVSASNDARIRGISGGYTVTSADGSKSEWYFSKVDGQNYYKRSIGDTPRPTPNNMSEREIIGRIKANGGTVDKKSASDLKREYEAYRRERSEMDKFLDGAYVGDRTFVKSTRDVIKSRRGASRASRR